MTERRQPAPKREADLRQNDAERRGNDDKTQFLQSNRPASGDADGTVILKPASSDTPEPDATDSLESSAPPPTIAIATDQDAEETAESPGTPTTVAAGAKPAKPTNEAEIPPPGTLSDPRSGLAGMRAGADRYHPCSTLGVGGMGRVYLVEDRDLKRRVALKMVIGEDKRHRFRFLDEAQILGQLEHPNIVPLYDIGTVGDEQLFCTLRYVRGDTLDNVLRGLKDGSLETAQMYSLTRLVQILMQISQAMDYAHSKRVVHRDLKPANVMLGEHGEVQVLDWGLAKVLDPSRPAATEALPQPVGGDPIETLSGSAKLTLAGHIVGTPAYMSPEQAMGQSVDELTDVYSLGTMLYEILTLTRPRRGSIYEQVEQAQSDKPPKPPRQVAPYRNIPVELERVCLSTLSYAPSDRPTARQFVDQLQVWLEAASDREKRRELADGKAREGARKLEDYHRLKREVKERGDEVEAVRQRFKDWQSVDEKQDLFASEDRLEQTRDQLMLRASEVVSTLGEALAFEGDNATARGLLADYYWERFITSEASRNWRERDFYGSLVGKYHDGKYSQELEGNGSLGLDTDPPGAEVWLFELEERRRCLVPRHQRRLGITPLQPVPLPMGSYLVILRLEGFRPARYPVFISRNRDWRGRLRLYTDAQIGETFRYVPEGPFIYGGDEGTRGYSGPRREIEIDGFFIAQHPVTNAQYMEFLNAIAEHDIDAALRRSPRRSPDGGSYAERTADGRIVLPEVDSEGDTWEPNDPVIAISSLDAEAYCRWRSSDGLEYRLPSEEEWEKAARSVDGRWFPWGERFDPSLCNMRASRRDAPDTVSIDQYPTDVSAYDVRGLAGNVRDWTSTEVPDAAGQDARQVRIARGGSFYAPPPVVRSAYRGKYPTMAVMGDVGFRLARSLPRE